MKSADALLFVAALAAPFVFVLAPIGPALTTGHAVVAFLLVPLLAGGLLARGAPSAPAAVLAAGLLAALRLVQVPLSCEPGIGLLSAAQAVLAAAAAWAGARLTRAGRERIESAWPLLAAVLLGWGLYQRFVVFPDLSARVASTDAAGRLASGRVWGPFALPAMYSAFLAGSCALFVARGRRVAAALTGAGLYLPLSLSGPVALALSFARRPAARRWAIAGLAAAGAVFFARGSEILGTGSPLLLRSSLWLGALRAAIAHPLGAGTGAFLSVYPAHALADAPLTSDPHQRFLLLLVENGPLAAILYVAALAPLLGARTPLGRFGLVVALVSQIDLVETDAALSALLFFAAGAEAGDRVAEENARASEASTAVPRLRALASAAIPALACLTLVAWIPLARAEAAWESARGVAERHELLPRFPLDADRRAMIARATSLHPSGDAVSARLWREAVARAPRRARLRAEAARHLASRGRLAAARAEIARARADAPGDPFVRRIEAEIR